MKRKFFVLSFMLGFCLFSTAEIKAQNDAFFVNPSEHRTSVNVGQGFNFGSFDTQQGGFGFEDFTGGDAPVGNGLLLMTATGLIYFINKRRKENE
jgi:hypothetical protein